MPAKTGEIYKFVVDCHHKHCREVRNYMAKEGYQVGMNDSWLGDHYGRKTFATERQANMAAKKLYEKYAKGRKVHCVTVVLPEFS